MSGASEGGVSPVWWGRNRDRMSVQGMGFAGCEDGGAGEWSIVAGQTLEEGHRRGPHPEGRNRETKGYMNEGG